MLFSFLPDSSCVGADAGIGSDLSYIKALGCIGAIQRKHRGGRSCATRLFHIEGNRMLVTLF